VPEKKQFLLLCHNEMCYNPKTVAHIALLKKKQKKKQFLLLCHNEMCYNPKTAHIALLKKKPKKKTVSTVVPQRNVLQSKDSSAHRLILHSRCAARGREYYRPQPVHIFFKKNKFLPNRLILHSRCAARGREYYRPQPVHIFRYMYIPIYIYIT
jgi:hypothetical protein